MTVSTGKSIVAVRLSLAIGALILAFSQLPARGEPLRVDNPAAEKKSYPEVEEGKKKLTQQDIEGAGIVQRSRQGTP